MNINQKITWLKENLAPHQLQGIEMESPSAQQIQQLYERYQQEYQSLYHEVKRIDLLPAEHKNLPFWELVFLLASHKELMKVTRQTHIVFFILAIGALIMSVQLLPFLIKNSSQTTLYWIAGIVSVVIQTLGVFFARYRVNKRMQLLQESRTDYMTRYHIRASAIELKSFILF